MKNALLIRNVLLKGEKVDVRISDGKFSCISSTPLSPLPDETLIDGSGFALTPAFYNLHGHAAMSLMRGFADDIELFAWLNEHVWPFEAKLKEEDIYNGTRLAILEMIKSGTVHFEDMYWFPQAAARAAKEMGIRARIGLLFLNSNEAAEKQNRECLERIDEFRGKVKISCAPHAIYSVNKETLLKAKKIAEDHDLILHIHVSETETEVKDSLKDFGATPVGYLDSLGILKETTVAAHCVHLTDEDIKIMAERKTFAVHVPGSNMKLASGVFPYKRCKAAGVRMVLGTDGCCSSNDLSMFQTMRQAALMAKVAWKDPVAAPAVEICQMASKVGAKAAGVNAGDIVVGKEADCLLIDLNVPCMVPCYDMVSNIVYSASNECVDTVICGGEILMRGRKVEGEEEIIAKARESVKRLAGR